MRFEIHHRVTLAHPVDVVFPVLALAADTERLLRLSSLVTTVNVLGTQPGPTPSSYVVSFEFGERVPILPRGLYDTEVTMRVEQTVDLVTRRVDYRSRTVGSSPLTVHKVRTFEGSDAGTTVDEVIHGEAPFGIHLIARRTANRAHREHLDNYWRLF